MTGKTHASCGLLIGMYLAKDYGISFESLVIISSAVAGSLIPDICHTKSYIGRRMPILSKVISLLFGHRSFTHSLLFMFLSYYLLNMLEVQSLYIESFIFGIASHIVLDIFTSSGVHLFYPIKVKVRSPISIRTGGMIDSLLFFVFLGSIYFVYFKTNPYIVIIIDL